MKASIILGVILVICHVVLASKKPDINAILFYSQQNLNTCKSPGLQCKDCETIQYCSSSDLESLFSIRCEDQSRLRPYCDSTTNTCVKDKPTVCEVAETSFHCPGTGYYPDLEDCANYHYCDDNKVATKFSCPAGSNWIQSNHTCTPGFYCRSYSAKLGQCKGKTNKLVAYAPEKNLYVLCLSKGPLLFQCPNEWEIFDDAEVACKFECAQNGFFPYPSDARKFYSCTKVGKGYESVLLECPESYEFVQLEVGQGICTYKTTTTTTTTAATTTPEEIWTTELVEEEQHEEESISGNEPEVEKEQHEEGNASGNEQEVEEQQQHEEVAKVNEAEQDQLEEVQNEEIQNENEEVSKQDEQLKSVEVEQQHEEAVESNDSEQNQLQEVHSEETQEKTENKIEETHDELNNENQILY